MALLSRAMIGARPTPDRRRPDLQRQDGPGARRSPSRAPAGSQGIDGLDDARRGAFAAEQDRESFSARRRPPIPGARQ